MGDVALLLFLLEYLRQHADLLILIVCDCRSGLVSAWCTLETLEAA